MKNTPRPALPPFLLLPLPLSTPHPSTSLGTQNCPVKPVGAMLRHLAYKRYADFANLMCIDSGIVSASERCMAPLCHEHQLQLGVAAEVKGVWAVHHTDAQTDTGMQLDVQGGPHHSYMLMSHPTSAETKVLETGDAMNQLTDAGAFVTDAPTICAGNILKHTLIVQASFADSLLQCLMKSSYTLDVSSKGPYSTHVGCSSTS